ncbi:hypothetical protein L1987_03088 [Smallanthus sonchifolius]|uniref:Uncharacterized protein n=1 Tax=Smallanthus sonchifolius TaxID=185202 RepID=A0ACB9K9L4_9ASTR|nr:hypothetical protein L1987_03088 [Smallanthus sonchifolius]
MIDKSECKSNDERHSTRRKLRFEDDHVYDFQINTNVDLVMDVSTSDNSTCTNNSRIEVPRSSNSDYEIENVDLQCKKDVPEIHVVNLVTSHGRTRSQSQGQDGVSEWLWTLHQIGYCQGMSDLLSPFIVLFEDNAVLLCINFRAICKVGAVLMIIKHDHQALVGQQY